MSERWKKQCQFLAWNVVNLIKNRPYDLMALRGAAEDLANCVPHLLERINELEAEND